MSTTSQTPLIGVSSSFQLGWEDTLAGIGRPQHIINQELRQCDYFIMILCDRWGSRNDMHGGGGYSSGYEEEYTVARECHERGTRGSWSCSSRT